MERWAERINPVILERGRQYAARGRVVSLAQANDGVYHAEVRGEFGYRVVVSADGKGGLKWAECTCPYDGPICKHVAAVLIILEGGAEVPQMAEAGPQRALRNLRERLQALSSEQLIGLLIDMAETSQAVAEHLKFVVSDGAQGEVDAARRLIRHHVDEAAERGGFVPWDEVGGAVEGAETVLERAAKIGDWRRALPLCLCAFEEMVYLVQQADDSDGTVGGVIESALEQMGGIVDRASATDRADIFEKLMAAADNKQLDGWSDWRLQLWELALGCAVTEDLKALWDSRVEGESARSDGYGTDYLAARISELQYEWLLQHRDGAAANAYLNQHLDVPELRKRAIELALAEGRDGDAMELAEEGERINHNLPGLVTQWRQLRYEAARRSGRTDVQTIVALAEVRSGNFSYYRKLKSLCSADDWPTVYANLLRDLDREDWYSASLYTKILVEEGETAKLMAFVQKNPATIEEYAGYLGKAYPDEVARLFRHHILGIAAHASSRGHYQDICVRIRHMARAGACQQADDLVEELRVAYPRKPAFQEELAQTLRAIR